MTSIPVSDVPLKSRYYVYRDVVLHQRTSADKDDDLYWQIKGGKPLREMPADKKRIRGTFFG